ncbi:MAG: hypothetical protein JXR52_07745 [Bacteroidales bacterium]|nr:hypothetical protein [Bacteroidales bacterium]
MQQFSPYDFDEYKIKSLKRRIFKILLTYGITMEEMLGRMQNDPVFLEEVILRLTVTTTELFRDPPEWKRLGELVLMELKQKDSITVWHPGCSTGQEVYTLMILLEEAGLLDRADIYASDINSRALDVAREGRYPYLQNVPNLNHFERLLDPSGTGSETVRPFPWKDYFSVNRNRDSLKMKKHLRDKPVYKKMDLVQDPNLFFVNFDLIICRNVILYFNDTLQKKVFDLFYRNMNHGACLMLGRRELMPDSFSGRLIEKDRFYFKTS